jgi:hypothetical protein
VTGLRVAVNAITVCIAVSRLDGAIEPDASDMACLFSYNGAY